jgi:hypothetical protein
MKKNWQSYSDNGFKVPEAYFDTFASHLKDEQQLRALDGLKKEGFRVPPNYFETVDVRIREHKKTAKVIPLWWSDSRALTASLSAVAAALVLLLLLWNPSSPQTNFTNISSTALNDYFEEQDIQEFLTYEELEKIEENTSIFESISLTDEVIFEMIDNQVLNDDLEHLPNK